VVEGSSFSQRAIMLRIVCDVHPGMQAFLGVLPHGLFAVTDSEGRFEIADVPAGEYRLVVWHEVLEGRESTLQVDDSVRSLHLVLEPSTDPSR